MDSELIHYLLSNAGVAGAVIVAIICGLLYPRNYVKDLKEENQRLRESLVLERARADAAVAAANSTNQILGALHEIASQARPDRTEGEFRRTLRGSVHEEI